MDSFKLFDAVAYLLYQNDGKLNYTKLIKELYLCDKESISRTGFPITGDEYVSMAQGPVLSNLYNFILNRYYDSCVQDKWNKIFVREDYDLRIIVDSYSNKLLSRFEKKTIERISNSYKENKWNEIVDNVVHNPNICPEWNPRAKIENTSIPITMESIYKSLGFSENQIKIAIEELEFYRSAE